MTVALFVTVAVVLVKLTPSSEYSPFEIEIDVAAVIPETVMLEVLIEPCATLACGAKLKVAGVRSDVVVLKSADMPPMVRVVVTVVESVSEDVWRTHTLALLDM